MENTKEDQMKEAARFLGSRGGKATARKFSKAQFSAWGKKGGRPKKVIHKTLASS